MRETTLPPHRSEHSRSQLALIENDRVVKVCPIAVGKAETPSPTGSFHVVSRVIDRTWYTKGKIVPLARQSARQPLDWPQ